MNHRPPGLETVKAIQGFLQYKSAEGLSHVPFTCFALVSFCYPFSIQVS